MWGHISTLKTWRNPFNSDEPGHLVKWTIIVKVKVNRSDNKQVSQFGFNSQIVHQTFKILFYIYLNMKIAFYRGTSLLDKLILFFSRGGYSHCSILFDNGSMIESKPFIGVQKCDTIFSSLKCDTKVDIFEVNTNRKQDKIIMDFLKNQIGKGYDYLSAIGFIVYSTNEGRKSYGRWFCSELVFSAFKKAGINLFERVSSWQISPTVLSYNTVMKQIDSIDFRYQQQ